MTNNPSIVRVALGNHMIGGILNLTGPGIYEADRWLDVLKVLNHFQFPTEDGFITFNINWKNSEIFIKGYDALFKMLWSNPTELKKLLSSPETSDPDTTEDDISFICELSSSNREFINNSSSAEYVLRFLYLLFLSLNISYPGSFSLVSPKIIVDDVCVDYEGNLSTYFNLINLSADKLEFSNSIPETYGWPDIKKLPFDQVWNWVLKLNIFDVVNAVTNTQKAIFAFIYATKAHSFEKQFELELIYLAYGLEALFDTPKQGIEAALRERIFTVLGTPEKNSQKVRQAINAFYELRSKFAHGDLELVNPIISPVFYPDSLTDNFDMPILYACNLADAIMISTFQKMVINKWSNLVFSISTTFDGK